MFSQLRNAVEHLAAQAVPVVSDASSSDRNSAEPVTRAGSLDINAARSSSPLSSSELAGSALSSLRKSLSAQRSASSTQAPKTPSPAPENTRPRKSNLEERLRRATFAIGDASSTSSSGRPSRVASPSPMGSNRMPMPKGQGQSAYSTPLPASPMVTPATESESNLSQPSNLSLESHTSQPQDDKTKTQVDAEPSTEEPPAALLFSMEKSQSTQSNDSSISTPEPQEVEPDVDPLKVETAPKDMSTKDIPALVAEEARSHSNSLTEASTTEELTIDSVQLDSLPVSNENPVEETISVSEVLSSKEEQSVENELSNEEEVILDKESPVETESPIKEESPVQEHSIIQEASTVKEASVTEDESQIDEDLPAKAELPIDEDVPVSEDSPAMEALPVKPSSPVEEDSPVKEDESLAKEEEGIKEHISVPDVNGAEVESLQARLKQVEQRFADVSTSFKRLQAEKLAADAVLRELSPVESIQDVDALREFFNEHKAKDKVFQDEIKRLNQKLELQEDRIEEMRDMHRLESHSRSDEVKKIRTQLDETETLFQAAQRATTNAEEVSDKRKEEIAQLQKEVEKSKNVAKEEEEKRVKAISLLKTVRQKLVKAEKDKEDTLKELGAVKEREKDDKDKELAKRMNFQQEIENLNASHEKAITTLKAQFNRDMASMRERYEQETSALRGQFALDLASTKTTYAKELGAKTSQITTLENSLNNVTRDKNVFFDQLQLRQAELESAQAHLESLQHQNTEFQFQLRESNDRLALMKEETSELLREQQNRARDPVASADEVARMVSATEAKYESRLSEVKRNLNILEKERYESEADWSRKLKEKVKELEDLKRVLGSATRTREADESVVARLKADLQQAQEKVKVLDRQSSELPLLREQILELEKTLKEQDQETSVKILVLEKQLEETKIREAQMKQSNKTLREELRKVQSSAALLERQRNPGVGYWTTRVSEGNGSPEPRTPTVSSPTVTASRVSSPTPSTTTSSNNEEEVNLEYLRNVILQFLEHKEMRPNLVKVLSIILHFTPQETRRLIAKV